jgi:hypothetical protein
MHPRALPPQLTYGLFTDYKELFYIGTCNPLHLRHRVAEHLSLSTTHNQQKRLFIIDAKIRGADITGRLLPFVAYYNNNHYNTNRNVPPFVVLPLRYKDVYANTVFGAAFLARHYHLYTPKDRLVIAEATITQWHMAFVAVGAIGGATHETLVKTLYAVKA